VYFGSPLEANVTTLRTALNTTIRSLRVARESVEPAGSGGAGERSGLFVGGDGKTGSPTHEHRTPSGNVTLTAAPMPESPSRDRGVGGGVGGGWEGETVMSGGELHPDVFDDARPKTPATPMDRKVSRCEVPVVGLITRLVGSEVKFTCCGVSTYTCSRPKLGPPPNLPATQPPDHPLLARFQGR
jgi:hypothetical protein